MNIRSLSSIALVVALAACHGGGTSPLPTKGQSVHRTLPKSVYASQCSAPLNEATGTVKEYPMPWPSSGPAGIAVDANQNVWTSDWNRSQIAEYTQSNQTWSQYATITQNAQPSDMTIGPDGNPWFAEKSGDHVGVVSESAGNVLSEYSFPGAFSIDSNPDGNLYASSLHGSLAQITTAGSVTTLSADGDIPFEISSDSAGNVWFTTDSSDGGIILERQPDGTFAQPFNPHIASGEAYGITEGPPGTGMWVTELAGNTIDNIAPNGTITKYPVPTANSQPNAIIAACGNLWFTERAANKIGRISPNGQIVEYNVTTPNAGPDRLAIDTNGNVWFSEYNVGKVAMIVTHGSPVVEIPAPYASSGPAGITADANGNVWVADWNRSYIEEYTPSTGTWSEIATPTGNSEPSDMTSGPDGNPWFTERSGNHIGRVNLSNNTISEFTVVGAFGIDTNPNGYIYASSSAGALERVSTNGSILGFGATGPPFEVSHDSLGTQNIWYTTADGSNGNHVMKRMANGTITPYTPSAPNSKPYGITEGPSGTGMWFTELNANKIGNISQSGTLSEYAIKTAGAQPDSIVSACGQLWFTERAANKIASMTTSGSILEYALPTPNSGPDRMWVDKSGNIWFTEFNAGQIGEVLAGDTCTTPLPK